MKLKRQTKNPRLLKEKKKLIRQGFADGFFNYEVAEIFRTTPSNITQLLKGRRIIIK